MSLLALALLFSVACTRSGSKFFRGNYSFKASGTLTVGFTRTSSSQTGESETASYETSLSSESGQMNILENGGGAMVVTMNIVNGPVLVFDAECEGSTLTLSPVRREISLKDEIGSDMKMNVTMSGEAEKLDNVVIFTMHYEGEKQVEKLTGSVKYVIEDSHVQCVATEN